MIQFSKKPVTQYSIRANNNWAPFMSELKKELQQERNGTSGDIKTGGTSGAPALRP